MTNPIDAIRLQLLHEETQDAIKLVNSSISMMQAQMLDLERCIAELLVARHKLANLTTPLSMRHGPSPRSPL